MRITVRSARKGKAVGALVTPSSKLIIGRSTVTGDIRDSPAGDGYASLTFTPVRATGLRVAFANPNPAGTCSSVPGTCNHYRVGELEAYAVP
jgi:hypothetical protein